MAVVTATIKPLAYLKNEMEHAGNGDFSRQYVFDGKDEIGDIGRSFEQMAKALKLLLTVAKENSFKVTTSSQELNATVEQASASSLEINDNVESVSGAMEDVSGVADNQATAAEILNSNINRFIVEAV